MFLSWRKATSVCRQWSESVKRCAAQGDLFSFVAADKDIFIIFTGKTEHIVRLKVAIVILNWNGEGHLRRFLPSVVRYTTEPYASVVVADNGSTDGSLALLRESFPEVEIVELDRNYGFAGGYNRALERVDADMFLLLNSDVEVTEGWLPPLVERMLSDGRIAAVMPKIRSYAERDMFEYAGAAGGLIDPLGYPYCRGRVLSHVERDNGQYDDAREIFWASGAAMLVRADLFRSLGGFDADYFAHMEEIDLCWRAKNRGMSVWVEPRSTVYHLGGGTLSAESPYKLFLNFRNNLATLFKNLPSSRLLPVLFTRMCVDGAIGTGYLVCGRFSRFAAVVKAHFAFYGMISALRRKRRLLPHPDGRPAGMSRGLLAFMALKRGLLEK